MRVLRLLIVAMALTSAFSVAAASPDHAFSQPLAQGCAEIAKFAVAKLHDESGQSYFQNKSDRAQANLAVDPEWPANWTLTPGLQQTMARERDGLVAALARVNTGADSKTEAIAQVNFDCWVALASIPTLQKESERCRSAFHAAMQQLGS
jgi:disulfide bond formation protein DsbB